MKLAEKKRCAAACRAVCGCKLGTKKKKTRRRKAKRGQLLRTRTYFYYALGNGEKKTFTNRDGMPGYRSKIPNPRRVSLTHVFVDGLLQAPESYTVRTGRLRFRSRLAPADEARIIAEFIAIGKHA